MSSSDLWQEDSSSVDMKKKTKEMKMRVVKVILTFKRPLDSRLFRVMNYAFNFLCRKSLSMAIRFDRNLLFRNVG